MIKNIDECFHSDSSESHADECPHMRDEKGKRKEKPSGKKRSKKVNIFKKYILFCASHTKLRALPSEGLYEVL